MTNNNLLKKFTEYDKDKPQKVTEISGLLGIPINGHQQVEVPNRNGFVYVRLRNSTNELIQAFNEKVSTVYGLPVLVKWNVNRYEVQGRDTTRYQDWGSFSAFLPRHGSQHSLNFESGQGGDVSFIYSRQFMPFATIPSGTDGAGTVFVMPHVYRDPINASWNYIGNESSANLLPAKPTGTSARMMLLSWDLSISHPLIITGSFFAGNLTGTSAILPYVPVVTNQNYIPLAAIRLVSGTQSILWDNIYDMRQYAVTTPPPFAGGFAVQDEGIPVGTGTTLNFFGDSVVASVSGSVIRVLITGTNLLDANISFSDITTNDTSTSKHGFAPKLQAPAANILNVLGIANGETVATSKSIFDAVAPSFLATAAAGTSLIAAHRDHVHSGDHTSLTTIGTNSHFTIDNHLASTDNSHSGTAAQVGAIPNDGWVAVSGWTYASATTITVSTGAASIYSVGDKIKMTNTGTKYNYIVTVADTLLTVVGDGVANSAITVPFYSKATSPLNFPQWFTFTTTPSRGTTPYTNLPTINTARFMVIGKTAYYLIEATMNATPGGSGYQTYTVSIPAAQRATGNGMNLSSGYGVVVFVETVAPNIRLFKYDGTQEAIASQIYFFNGCYEIA